MKLNTEKFLYWIIFNLENKLWIVKSNIKNKIKNLITVRKLGSCPMLPTQLTAFNILKTH